MRVLVIGSGGREHAVVRRLARSPLAEAVYALPGNPGMREAIRVPGDPMDLPAVASAAREHGIGFAVVTPDDPLAAGLVDALEARGIPCFGPDRRAAQIESSKVFAKGLMQRHGIPTARWQAFDGAREALAYADSRPLPLVVKADGLARGKGVVIARSREKARQAIRDMLEADVFGESGRRVVVEEYLTGPEVSVLCLCDGDTVLPLLSAMDHKRALKGDRGPNTGGMGAVAPNPFYRGELKERALKEIIRPTVEAMAREGRPFRGCLFFGLILTREGPKVLEYNARLGDPETQALLPLLEGDLLEAMMAAREGRLHRLSLGFRPLCSCCVVLASGGYPGAFETGFPIEVDGVPEADIDYAGVAERDGRLCTAGGRVMSLTATGPTMAEAVARAYGAVGRVRFAKMHFRTDIGQHALQAEA